MGLDLNLLPVDSPSAMDHMMYSHTVLQCVRRGVLFDEIRRLRPVVVKKPFYTYLGTHRAECGEHGYGKTEEDPYGDPITTVTVGQLLTLAGHEEVMDSSQNRAIWAYLGHLDHETLVGLYWH